MIRSWLLATLLLVAAAGGAEARSEKSLAYPRDQAWAAALRFLVVDEHVKVTEKDADAGYVIFELRDEGKTFRGTLEVVSTEDDGRKVVLFVVQIADRPSWIEVQMLERLEHKLRIELGSPASPPTQKKGPPPAAGDEPKDPPKDEKKPDKDPPKDDDGPPISPTP